MKFKKIISPEYHKSMVYHNKTNQRILRLIQEPAHVGRISELTKKPIDFISKRLGDMYKLGLVDYYKNHKDCRIKYYYALPVEVPSKELMTALNHKHRIKIMEVVDGNSTNEISEAIDLDIEKTKRHLRILRSAGLVESTRKKGLTLYWNKT